MKVGDKAIISTKKELIIGEILQIDDDEDIIQLIAGTEKTFWYSKNCVFPLTPANIKLAEDLKSILKAQEILNTTYENLRQKLETGE